MISPIKGRLSCGPGCSPRAAQASWAAWRKSRRAEKVRNGSTEARANVIA